MKFPCNTILIIIVNLVKICIPLNSYYSAIPELDNKIGTSHLLHETSASSSSVCGAMCRNNCNCFGYNPLQKRCRIHVFCKYIDMITTATGWQYYRAASDCMALYQNGQTTSGVYSIHPKEGARTDVVCDMETMGGGWTIIQNRFDGSESFSRNWIDYKVGFGTANGEYWIELDNKIGTSHLLHETSASSSSVCGAMCRNNCNCFGYNPLQKRCRIHVFCEYIDMITTATGWQYYRAASDCLALYQNGQTTSGVYSIHPKEGARTDVVCDMETMGGGWTIIQNRFDGSESFSRNWIDYKAGFGTAYGEYWIGNEALHQLTTTDVNSLYVSITLNNGSSFFELYETFSISSELDNYRLSVGGQASGTLGDRISNTGSAGDDINGMMFSSVDRDNDRHSGGHCAQEHNGGWWFNICHDAYLNGPYGSSSWQQPWYPLLSTGEIIKKTTMMIRRK